MQDLFSYIPETNHVSRVCSVAVVLYLQFVLHVISPVKSIIIIIIVFVSVIRRCCAYCQRLFATIL
jgi:hypothetical protein